MTSPSFRRLSAALLVLPMLAFICAFFVWPLAGVMFQSVSDGSVARILPETTRALAGWDGASPVLGSAQRALVSDLTAIGDQQALGEVVRRLNSAKEGFRTLMGKTSAAVKDDPAADLVELDPRWGDPEFWRTIKAASSAYTDRNLLAALDFERGSDGRVRQMPEGEGANRVILTRTFTVAATVTLFCMLLGVPYAMLTAYRERPAVA